MDGESAPSRVPGISEGPTGPIRISEAAPGSAIGPYQLVRQLGEGGMGVVFHAQQLRPIRRDVALKVIKPGMDSKQVIARFETERQALAMMDHPNIAHVFDAGTTDRGLPYFVMELVEGVPITRYCDSKRLTVRERIELFMPVCRALQHAHQKGIIHRDIKPSNIMVTQQEGGAVPKVIDFGCAKALGGYATGATMMTNVGTVVGTLEYMSPEQAELGRHDVDTRSDIYSLGAVLYELLAGTTPLERDRLVTASYLEILQSIREQEPKPPSTRLRHSGGRKETAACRRSDPERLPKLLHHELDWIIMKALDKDRTRRYETVNGLARDLERYLQSEPVEAAPPSAAYRMGKFVHKHRLGLATAAALLLVLTAGAVFSAWMAVRATRAEQEARQSAEAAEAVSDFLENDLLAQASANTQARPGTKPDPDLKVRTALDRAAGRIEGRFAGRPLVEASIRHTIGNTYRELGLYGEAQHQLEQALDLRRAARGDADPLTMEAMNNLAVLYRVEGKYAQAEPLYERVIELRRRLLGEEHPDTLVSVNNLGVLYLSQGKYPQAEPLLTRVVEAQRRVFGPEHPETVRAMNNLATCYASNGNFAQAETLYKQALEIRRKVLGEEHPNTVLSLSNLARLYLRQGDYVKAEPLLNDALAARRRLLGEQHPDTLLSMNSVGELYVKQGRFALAEPLFARVAELRHQVLGENHPDTLRTMTLLGDVEFRQHKYADAETVLRKALATYEKLDVKVWDRYVAQSLLGASVAGQGKYDRAEPLALSGYQAMIQRRATMPTGERLTLQDAGERIVRLYQDWGKPEKAAEWQQKIQSTNPSANR